MNKTLGVKLTGSLEIDKTTMIKTIRPMNKNMNKMIDNKNKMIDKVRKKSKQMDFILNKTICKKKTTPKVVMKLL